LDADWHPGCRVRSPGGVASGALVVALGVGATLSIDGVQYPTRFARDFDVRLLAAAAQGLTPSGCTLTSG
jgi:hypothetical protein